MPVADYGDVNIVINVKRIRIQTELEVKTWYLMQKTNRTDDSRFAPAKRSKRVKCDFRTRLSWFTAVSMRKRTIVLGNDTAVGFKSSRNGAGLNRIKTAIDNASRLGESFVSGTILFCDELRALCITRESQELSAFTAQIHFHGWTYHLLGRTHSISSSDRD